MESEPGSYLAIIILSILFSGFFSGMEMAFISANRLKIELNKKQSKFPAKIIDLFVNNSSQFISTMLVGNNIALVIYGIGMANLLEPIIALIAKAPFAILLIQTIIATVVIIFTAEYLPKTMFQRMPNTALNVFAVPLMFFYILLYPLAKLSTVLSNNFLSSIFNVQIDSEKKERAFSKVDLNNYVWQKDLNYEQESKVQNDIKIFRNALGFSDIKVKECMVPRNEIVPLEIEESLDELVKLFADTGFSKIPIYRENIDNIIGYFHVADIFNKPRSIQSKRKEMPIVPETMHAHKLLKRLIRNRKSIALVVDEFGGTSGIVTIEDLMEEIVGEIEDEHDKIDLIEEKRGSAYFLSARFEIDYVNEKYGFNLPENESYETIAGFIIDYFKDIPTEQSELETPGYTIKVEEVEENRIKTVSVQPKIQSRNGKNGANGKDEPNYKQD